MSLLVMKFGGTSVGNAEAMERAAALVARAEKTHRVVVVVSALAGVTDAIVAALHAAKSGATTDLSRACEEMRSRHRAMIAELLPPEAGLPVEAALDGVLARLREICSGMAQLRASAPQIADMALSLGEEMSARILVACLERQGVASAYVDSARVLVTDTKFGEANPDMEATATQSRAILLPLVDAGSVPVVTGYRGATPAGQWTTLGRGGSDFSATILGAALGADEIWIWTDVDGVLTADPRICPGAATLREITFAEAVELSHYGAKVIHQRAIRPAMDAGIPVWIKNSFRPDDPGTRIARGTSTEETPVKAITAVTRASLLTLSTRQDIHSAEIFGRLLMRLAAEHVDLLFSTQSSQTAIGLVIREQDDQHVMEVIRKLFRTELRHEVLNPVSLERNIAVVTVLGESMKGHPGILARLFTAVAARQVSVIAVAQGASEMTICFAVPSPKVDEVVQAVHQEFGLDAAPANPAGWSDAMPASGLCC